MAELRWLDLGRSAAGEGFVRAIAGLTSTRLLGVCLGEPSLGTSVSASVGTSVSQQAVDEVRRM